MDPADRLTYEAERLREAVREARAFDPERPHYLWSLLAEASSFAGRPSHAAAVRELREVVRRSAAGTDEDVLALLADLPEAAATAAPGG